MFDIGFPELVLAGVIALIILGPERLPGALRTMGLWLGRLRRGYYRAKTEIEKEIGMDEVRRQLHNEQIMEDVRRMEQEVNAIGSEITGEAAPPVPGAAAKETDGEGATARDARIVQGEGDAAQNAQAMQDDRPAQDMPVTSPASPTEAAPAPERTPSD